jgi:Tfp pilus assembly protein PilF
MTRRTFPTLFATITLAVALGAQDWRGMGRIGGKVTDEKAQPIEGVVVKAALPTGGGTTTKTNKKGEWAIGGIARGEWQVDFEKEGYQPRRISVAVSETTRLPPIEISLVKAAPVVDANAEIRAELERAATLMGAKQFAQARVVYEALLARYAELHQLHPYIARAYYGENQHDKAIEHLRLALAKDPANVEVQLLLGNILVEKGDAEEGKRILAGIDESRVKDPTIFINVGIAMLNQNKPADAVPYFEKAITRFPESPDAYYYRGIAHLQLGRTEEAKADLTKFVAMAPDAPETPTAKKILEQLKN